ncbi:MAG: LPS assembly lipoprotein LptE [Candidatus Omnitrophota bacterium]
MRLVISMFLTLFMVSAVGCGYTTDSLLPPELSSIHIDNFENKINVSGVVSNKRQVYSYWPGLEVDITRAVIDKFIFDRRLEVDSSEKATMQLKGTLVDFRLYPLSYNQEDNIEEFRVEVYVDLELHNNLTGELMWKESRFMGQYDFRVTGPNAKTETAAVNGAVVDLSERIEERVIEAW